MHHARLHPCPSRRGPRPAVECRTSDITLDEFKTLQAARWTPAIPPRPASKSIWTATPAFRTDLYATQAGTLMTHAKSIGALQVARRQVHARAEGGVGVEMPFDGGSTQEMYAQKLIDKYKAAGVVASGCLCRNPSTSTICSTGSRPSRNSGRQAVFLVDHTTRSRVSTTKIRLPGGHDMAELKAQGVN